MGKFRLSVLCLAAIVVAFVASEAQACDGFAVQSFGVQSYGCQPAFVQSFGVQSHYAPQAFVFAQPSVFVQAGHRNRVFVNRGANVQVNAVGADVRVRRGFGGRTVVRVR